MSRYSPLGRYLEGLGRERVGMGFEEIERILGFSLPKSARTYRAWWANEARGSHSHAKYGWMHGGYRVHSLSFKTERVTFVREDGGSRTRQPVLGDRKGLPTPYEFEELGRKAMEKYFGTEFQSREAGGVPKVFDYVSGDGRVVGDAKYFSMERGIGVPPAKFSTISEYVWLLGHVEAETRFLLFGNDRRVPEQWLERYGGLVLGIDFYFLDSKGRLTPLAPQEEGIAVEGGE